MTRPVLPPAWLAVLQEPPDLVAGKKDVGTWPHDLPPLIPR